MLVVGVLVKLLQDRLDYNSLVRIDRYPRPLYSLILEL